MSDQQPISMQVNQSRIMAGFLLLAMLLAALASAEVIGDAAGGMDRTAGSSTAPWLRLSAASPLTSGSVPEVDTSPIEPRSLTAAFLDANAVPDIVVGSVRNEQGLLTVFLGDPGAYPTRGSKPPFLPGSRSIEVTVAPDMLAAGDFDGDGTEDLVVASRSASALTLLKANGDGELRCLRTLDVGGQVSALHAGEVNRRDGLSDLMVAVATEGQARLLVFESPSGAWNAEPEVYELPAPATAIALGRLDSDMTLDIAVAAGHEIVVVRGRDRRLAWTASVRADVGAAMVDRITLDEPALAVAVGKVAARRSQLLVVAAQGQVSEVRLTDSGVWRVVQSDVEVEVDDAGPSPALVTARLTSLPRADLLMTGVNNGELRIANLEGPTSKSDITSPFSARVPLPHSVVAAVAIRLNLDALDDLVFVTANDPTPQAMLTVAGVTYEVNSTDDTVDGVCDTAHCSLREAIQLANASPGLDTIEFSVGNSVIQPTSTMTSPTEPLLIDGRQGVSPFITFTHLDGGACASSGCDGLYLGYTSSGLSVADMIITGFNDNAVWIRGDDSFVTGCYIGINFDGTPAGNGGDGVAIGGDNNVVGGSSSERNVISSNGGHGVLIRYDGQDAAYDNSVRGNYIGTDRLASAPRPNGGNGVHLEWTTGNTIGNSQSPNVISGNDGDGVDVHWQAQSITTEDNLVMRNLIGVAGDGTTPLANGHHGIHVTGSGNTIGGLSLGYRNIVAGNTESGIMIRVHAIDNVVQGNFIGLASDGSTAVGNLGDGITIDRCDSNLIGGTTSGAGNVISANDDNGVSIVTGQGAATEHNSVLGNLIGTDASGTACRGNAGHGVFVDGNNNTIGDASGGNVVACNEYDGINIGSGCTGNTVRTNLVGVAADGTTALSNLGNGVHVWGDVYQATIGGLEASLHNTIANNGGAGVLVATSGASYPNIVAIRGNSISGNGGLGVDLSHQSSGDGVTANDTDDSDDGPNTLQNFPQVTSYDPLSQTVCYSLDSTPDQVYTIELFATEACDASGYGEGELLLGTRTLATDEDGTGSDSLATTALDESWFITARAVHATGRTSEFSSCYQVTSIEAGDVNADATHDAGDLSGLVRLLSDSTWDPPGNGDCSTDCDVLLDDILCLATHLFAS